VSEIYVVFGATGNTGKRIAEGLLSAGKRVRVVARSRDKLSMHVERGAEAFATSAIDTPTITRALSGATAAYVMVPPIDYADPLCDAGLPDAISESLVSALRNSGVPFAVNLSSLGANHPGMMEQIDSLRRHEQRLRTVPSLSVVHLRPGFFMEGLLDQVPTVVQTGFFAYPLEPDICIPMVAAADIAGVALKRLLALDFRGETAIELPGPRDVSMAEAARVLGRAAGIVDPQYLHIPIDQFRWSLEQSGVRPEIIGILTSTVGFLNSGSFQATYPRQDEALRMTALEAFASTFAIRFSEYRAMASSD
jgi:uncharacterized protein YbjT (DUF2867 family)